MPIPNRICPQCGTLLSPNERFCHNCGARAIEPAVIEPTQQALSNQTGSASYQPQFESTQYAGPSSLPLPSSSTSDGNTAYGSAGQSYSADANYTPPPPPNVGYVPSAAAYGGTSGQSSPMQPPQRRKRPGMAITLGLILLVLMVVGGGIFFLSRLKSNDTTIVNKTPTVASKSTTPVLRPLFADNFADNSQGWDIGSGSGFSSTISNNVMTLSEANHKILDEPIPGTGKTAATYIDFSVTTTFTITKADQNDSVGLYMRGDDNLSQGYFVDIFGDNTYDIVKVFPDSSKDTFLVSPTNSSSINSVGQQNKLTVIMKGPKIEVLVNNKVLNSISDSAYTSGQIALFAENGKSSNGVKAAFSSMAIYPAPDQLPS
ncbi:MAG: hypothetical protein NVSMB33_13260 [Ktedonobacteraceae bacterium]